MSSPGSDLRRVLSASGIYALAALGQRAVSFLLLPVYTRFLDPAEYGALELLTTFSFVLFGLLMLGLPSAVTKVYHRDCEGGEEQSRLLATALAIELPVLLVGGGLVVTVAERVGRLLIEEPGSGYLIHLVVATGVLSSLVAVVLASFRAQERAVAFSLLTLVQFAAAMLLNVLFVVVYHLGVAGVLWGNLLSNLLALPLALAVAFRGDRLGLSRRLVRPLLSFGLLLIPVVLFGWVIDLSDRWVLRLFRDLDEVAVYGVGYKIGMVLQVALVWPFQLAWPAVSFSISHQPGHKATYARVTTYFTLLLTLGVLGLALLSRSALTAIAGEAYREAHRVVPLVACAYALNGLYYCLSPGLHLGGKTRYLPLFSGFAAVLNLGLNFLLIPRFGMLGAAWATVAAFLLLAAVVAWMSQRTYPVAYETGRLARIALAGLLVYAAAVAFEPPGLTAGLIWHGLMAVVAFPALLAALGFMRGEERLLLGRVVRRYLLFRTS